MPDTHSAAPPYMTGDTCMCLPVILLVNNFHCWLVETEKYNVHCKTFPHCTREMNMSQKLFFYIKEKRLYHKNAFLTLFSYYICLYICIYMCAYVFLNVYNISMVMNICIIMFCLLFGIEMTVLLCFLPMI